ncbi:hypothetical protein SE17_17190 [Kouleothrix aurantiaca]|uniref:Gp28/Gp37-like domain-containing protein n=1 Tax=Kouleothrix aurantiaca TaxID=186479 RepID=A0A0P9FGB3_9CHLR|nr:hypothetical protein SE17_17190 [Kouleothrix aurantiaca]
MSVRVQARIADPLGAPLATIANFAGGDDAAALDYTICSAPGAVGVCEISLPRSVSSDILLRDGRITLERSIDGRAFAPDNDVVYTMETFRYVRGRRHITAYQATGLLGRRIVAYPAGSSYALKAAAAAGDQLLTFARENLGASISAANRDGAETQADVSAYLSIPANSGLGASVAKAAARRRLDEVARELCEASALAGTYLTYEIANAGGGLLELRVFAGQRGVDRTATITLSEAAGTLANSTLTIDYHNEATWAVAAGAGEGVDRLIATQLDATRISASPFGRIERFVDRSNVTDATALQDDADTAVRAGRPTITLTGELRETFRFVRGIDFDLGDLVSAASPETPQTFTMRLEMVRETWNSSGRAQQIGLREVT